MLTTHRILRIVALITMTELVCLNASAATVGRTPGAASVTQSGAASYSIPLSLPPGRNGLTPSLSLNYNHNTGNGLLGMGWSIGGLSAISRCYKTFDQDQQNSAPFLAASDAYCLDGNRLRLTSAQGTYGADGSTYQTEIETFSRVTARRTAGGGPESWRVERKDGSIYEYGGTTDSRILSVGNGTARLWALNRIEDRAGNYIDFVYTQENGSYRPSQILYTGHTSFAAFTRIDFVYETASRTDRIYGFRFGQTSLISEAIVNQFARLDRIDVVDIASGATTRTIELTYQSLGGAGARSRLASIQECSSGDCLAATTLRWIDGTPSWSATEGNTGQALPDKSFVGDVDGDGRDDLLFAGASTWLYMLGSDGGLSTPIDTGVSSVNQAEAQAIEWDGDGLMDVLVPCNGTATWCVLQSNGSGLSAPFNTGTPSTGSNGQVLAADVDGDGRDDLVRQIRSGTHSLGVRLRGTNGFAAEVIAWTSALPIHKFAYDFSTSKPMGLRRRMDFNGDGREDFVVRIFEDEPEPEDQDFIYVKPFYGLGNVLSMSNMSLCVSTTGGACSGPSAIGDFNGDGLTDLLLRGSTNYYIHLGKGESVSIGVAGPAVSATSTGSIVAADYDADGLDDLLFPRTVAGSTTWQLARSTGNGFTELIDIGLVTSASTAGFAFAADVNGDRLTDILRTDAGSVKYRLHNGVYPDLLDAISDGHGNYADFNYRPIALGAGCYELDGTSPGYPRQRYRDPSHVVCSLSASAGNGESHTTSYNYHNAVTDLARRSFLGFERKSSRDSRDDIQHIERFSQQFPNAGMRASYSIRQPNGTTPIREVVDTLTFHPFYVVADGPQTRWFPYVSQRVSKDHEMGGSYNGLLKRTVTIDNTMDPSSGVITDLVTTVVEGPNANGINGGQSHRFETHHPDLFDDTTHWCLGRPRRTEQTNSHALPGGAQITRTSEVHWDGQHCRPIYSVIEPGSSLEVRTDYGYDDFGNRDDISSIPAPGQGQDPRQTRIYWGADGRFPRTITNPKGHATQLQWDTESGDCAAGGSHLGMIRCVTDSNGLTVRYDWDGFGRLLREQLPDGTATDYTLGACNAGNSYCGGADDLRAYVQATVRDTANNAIRTDTQYFDGLERLRYDDRQTLTGASSRVTTTYDASGRVSATSTPFTSADPVWYTTVQYDPLDRPTLIRRPASERDNSDLEVHIRYDGLRTTTTDPLNRDATAVYNGIGQIVQAIDAAGGDTDYEYDAFGNLLKARDISGREITLTYNARGMKESMSDPDMGTLQYRYYPFGELKRQTYESGAFVELTYDELSRLLRRDEAEGSTRWTWDTATNGIGRLVSVESPGGYSEFYSYDDYGRQSQTRINADSTDHFYNFSYGTTGLLETLTYPISTSGVRFKLLYGYQYGLPQNVRDYTGDALGTIYWQAIAANASGQVIDEQYGNGLRTISGYDRISGTLDDRTTGPGGGSSIQNLAYEWDKAGNLANRQDLNQGLLESFHYDPLYRLDYSLLNGQSNLDPAYDPMGRIVSMSDSSPSPRNSTSTTWYSYNLPNTITQTGASGASSQFFYGPDRARWKQVSTSGSSSETWTYLGGLMEKRQVGATTEYRHYIYGATGPAAIARRISTGANATHYLTTDHLGSTDVITDSAGAVLLRASFDAFGNRRGANWSGPPSSSDYEQIANTTRRGFTFHEHLDNLSMIHMNGRVYDGASGQFTSADPFVQAPYFSQSLNRYSYTFNNPLSYTDPSGFTAMGPAERPVSGLDFDDIGDFFGDLAGWYTWPFSYNGNGACPSDLRSEEAWRSCIGLPWPRDPIVQVASGGKTSNSADPTFSTVGGLRANFANEYGGFTNVAPASLERLRASVSLIGILEEWTFSRSLATTAGGSFVDALPPGQYKLDWFGSNRGGRAQEHSFIVYQSLSDGSYLFDWTHVGVFSPSGNMDMIPFPNGIPIPGGYKLVLVEHSHPFPFGSFMGAVGLPAAGRGPSCGDMLLAERYPDAHFVIRAKGPGTHDEFLYFGPTSGTGGRSARCGR